MSTSFVSVVRLTVLRGGLGGILLLQSLFPASVAEAAPAGRVTGTFEGIECEYSPEREALAQLIAHRLVLHNQEILTELAAKESAPEPIKALSPAELRANRPAYLNGIAAQLALNKPTSLQEECYDAFLDNYEQTMLLMSDMRKVVETLQIVKRVMIWDRDDLVRRLGAGEALDGLTYDPVTKKGDVTFGFSNTWQDDRFKDLAAKRDKLRREYRMSIGQENGKTVYRGSVSPKKNTVTAASNAPENSPTEIKKSNLFPVIIPTELATLPAAALAQKLWESNDGLAAMLHGIAEMKEAVKTVDPTFAYLILHETTELGIVDHYFHGPDRRWFCDGVANYVPWRVVNDLHGATIAATVYNLPAQLAQYASFREQADLRKWPAAENQSDEEQHTDLNSARYAFAANAVFLMNERAGQNALPRLFRELGKTNADKVSMKSVEKAWKKISGTKLDTILDDAVKPLPALAKSAPESTEPKILK